MHKLLVVPGDCTILGGNTVSPSLMIKGFERCGALEQLCVLVQAGSLMEEYLRQAGQGGLFTSHPGPRQAPVCPTGTPMGR